MIIISTTFHTIQSIYFINRKGCFDIPLKFCDVLYVQEIQGLLAALSPQLCSKSPESFEEQVNNFRCELHIVSQHDQQLHCLRVSKLSTNPWGERNRTLFSNELGGDSLFTSHSAKWFERASKKNLSHQTLPKWRLAACCYVRWGSMQIWWVQEHFIGPDSFVKKSRDQNNTETYSTRTTAQWIWGSGWCNYLIHPNIIWDAETGPHDHQLSGTFYILWLRTVNG